MITSIFDSFRGSLWLMLVVVSMISVPQAGVTHEGEVHGGKEEKTNPALMLTNTMCPVMTENKVDPEIFVDYAGKRIYLCCAKCKKKFLESPELYLVNLPQFAEPHTKDAGTSGTAPMAMMAMDHEHGAMEGHDHAGEADHDHAEASKDGDGPGGVMQERHDKNIGHKHNHATDHGQPVGIGRVIRFAGKFHPVMVHFPIALILAAALAELLGMAFKKGFFADCAFFLLILGAASAIMTVALGWSAAAYAHFPGMEWVLTLHRWLGTTTGAMALVAAILALRARKSKTAGSIKAYRVALFIGAALVGVTGHFGAALIYGLNHFTF